jgi:2-iminobutanoate/2-iminopropanoate deaminase
MRSGGHVNTLAKIVFATSCLLLPLQAMAAPADPPRRYIADPASKAPLSQAVLVRDTLYVSGALGVDKEGHVPADAKAEIKLVLDKMRQTIESAGLKMDDLVSVQIFCTDLALFDTFNEIYRTYFNGNFPARAFIGTDKLLRGAHFEVMGIAVKGK